MTWNNDEMTYCRKLVDSHGDDAVTRNPSTIASYLRLQAAAAFRKGDYEAAARLGHAATAINWSADNKHTPNWTEAYRALNGKVEAR